VAPSKFLKKLRINGNGLYANRNYKAGDVVIEYIGRTITDKEAESKSRFSQCMFDVKVNGKVIHVIDSANNKYSSAAKFVNSSSSWHSRQRNAEFKQYNQSVYLVATKGIRAGTEIISYYVLYTNRDGLQSCTTIFFSYGLKLGDQRRSEQTTNMTPRV
jgi:SET domain-containing protein